MEQQPQQLQEAAMSDDVSAASGDDDDGCGGVGSASEPAVTPLPSGAEAVLQGLSLCDDGLGFRMNAAATAATSAMSGLTTHAAVVTAATTATAAAASAATMATVSVAAGMPSAPAPATPTGAKAASAACSTPASTTCAPPVLWPTDHSDHLGLRDFARHLKLSDDGVHDDVRVLAKLSATPSPILTTKQATVTYINRGQWYALTMSTPEHAACKSTLSLQVGERGRQHHIRSWCTRNPGRQIIEADEEGCVNVSITELVESEGSVRFAWSYEKLAELRFRINCLSTDFTENKRGGETGVRLVLGLHTALEFSPLQVQNTYLECIIKSYRDTAGRQLRKDQKRAQGDSGLPLLAAVDTDCTWLLPPSRADGDQSALQYVSTVTPAFKIEPGLAFPSAAGAVSSASASNSCNTSRNGTAESSFGSLSSPGGRGSTSNCVDMGSCRRDSPASASLPQLMSFHGDDTLMSLSASGLFAGLGLNCRESDIQRQAPPREPSQQVAGQSAICQLLNMFALADSPPAKKMATTAAAISAPGLSGSLLARALQRPIAAAAAMAERHISSSCGGSGTDAESCGSGNKNFACEGNGGCMLGRGSGDGAGDNGTDSEAHGCGSKHPAPANSPSAASTPAATPSSADPTTPTLGATGIGLLASKDVATDILSPSSLLSASTAAPQNLTEESSRHEVQLWLRNNDFGDFCRQFVHYDGSVMLMLTREDCKDICAPNIAEGIRLYSQLHMRPRQFKRLCLETYTQTETSTATQTDVSNGDADDSQ
jgi:hypothetical protein